jgi:hypothetical protein
MLFSSVIYLVDIPSNIVAPSSSSVENLQVVSSSHKHICGSISLALKCSFLEPNSSLNLDTLTWSTPSPPTGLGRTPAARSATVSGGDSAAS